MRSILLVMVGAALIAVMLAVGSAGSAFGQGLREDNPHFYEACEPEVDPDCFVVDDEPIVVGKAENAEAKADEHGAV